MLNITTEPTEPNLGTEKAAPKKASLKGYLLEKLIARYSPNAACASVSLPWAVSASPNRHCASASAL